MSSEVRRTGFKSFLYILTVKLTEFIKTWFLKIQRKTQACPTELLLNTHILTYMIKFAKSKDEEKIF